MSIVACAFMGRFGNNCFQYAHCRAYAERHGFEFQCDPWIGQKVFGLNDPPIENRDKLAQRCENTLVDGEGDVILRSYFQNQKSLIYTRRDCLRWFRFTEEIEDRLSGICIPVAAWHIRRTDFKGYAYPMPSQESYARFHEEHFSRFDPRIISDESPTDHLRFNGDLADIPDFWLMTKAPILLRANSTFSWWAGTLNHGAVYSPIMGGLEGGKEHDVQFVRGNWPAFRTDLPFLSDLHLPE